MPYLYLFQIDSLVCGKSQRNYAIISEKPQTRLVNLAVGETTSVFNEFGLQYDFINYKSTHTFAQSHFEQLLDFLGKNPTGKLLVITEKNKIILHMGNTLLELEVGNYSGSSGETIYKYVGVYK